VRSSSLTLVPWLVVVGLAGPVLVGLLAVLLPALGWWPVLGGHDIGTAVIRDLLATPGLMTSVRLTLFAGLGSTAMALVVAVLILAVLERWPQARALRLAWAPLPAISHVAVAIAFAFLIAPSGLILRLVSPWLTGFHDPPDWATVQDPRGLALLAGLVLKEVPFLLLVAGASLDASTRRRLSVARSLGYAPFAAWMAAVFPQLYGRLRLPVLAVLVFATSSVDMALILGPTTPPTLPVMLLRDTTSADLAMRFRAAAGALLLLGVAGLAVGAWLLLERLCAWLGTLWLQRGTRRWLEQPALAAGGALAVLLAATAAMAFLTVVAWSFATDWRFPRLIPAGLEFATWARHAQGAIGLALTACGIAVAATGLAFVLVVACLEAETRTGRRNLALERLVFAPLLVPELPFLIGLQIVLLGAGLDGRPATVAAVHLLFVLPYVYLALAGPWRALDRRYGMVAATLGKAPAKVLFRVRLPLLARPAALALAIGFSVSLAQYLSTVMIGGGAVQTITTEAVTRASGGDRRIVAVYALIQMFLPGLAFLLAARMPQRPGAPGRATGP
jgi:putative thiamine transport system permease protein